MGGSTETSRRVVFDRCPECGGISFEGGQFEVFGDCAIQRCSCACGAEWVDTYRLESTEVLRPRHEAVTDYTCPRCGNRGGFTLDAAYVTVTDVPVDRTGFHFTAGNLPREDDTDAIDMGQGAQLTCPACGYSGDVDCFDGPSSDAPGGAAGERR